MSVSDACFMLAHRQCTDPACDCPHHHRNLSRTPGPASGPAIASPAPGPDAPFSAAKTDRSSAVGVGGAAGAEGGAGASRGSGVPALPPSMDRPPFYGEHGCRFADADPLHVCRTSFGQELEPGQVCFAEARQALRDEIGQEFVA